VSDSLPLQGYTVIEFTHTVMGPAAGLFLADLGAEVIRIEPLDGDRTRRLKGSGLGYFGFYNRNKRTIAVDLKRAEARPAIDALLQRADALIENFGPGTLDKLGYDAERVAALNPRLVYCSLKGFLEGPYEHRAGLDEVVQMMSGLAYMTGLPGRPLRAGASVIDVMGGLFGAYGILAALLERERTGRGQIVRSGLFETAVLLMGQHLVQAKLGGQPLQPMSVRTSAWAIYDIFQSSDALPIFLGVISDPQWLRFCEFFGLLPLRDDLSLRTNNARIAARGRILPQVIERVQGLTRAQICLLAEQASIPFAPVQHPEDLFDDSHLIQTGHLAPSRIDGIDVAVPAQPFQMAARRFGLRRDPAPAGTDTEEVLLECGLTPENLAELIAGDVVRTYK
jgi:crotonobetainyl-CoA:carnitine CoA-transferase CaiB-like acyl-CoA transferase